MSFKDRLQHVKQSADEAIWFVSPWLIVFGLLAAYMFVGLSTLPNTAVEERTHYRMEYNESVRLNWDNVTRASFKPDELDENGRPLDKYGPPFHNLDIQCLHDLPGLQARWRNTTNQNYMEVVNPYQVPVELDKWQLQRCIRNNEETTITLH